MKTLKGMVPELFGVLTGAAIMLSFWGANDPAPYVGALLAFTVLFVFRWVEGL